MNLHEYQAKRLFRETGMAVPEGQLITDISQLDSMLENRNQETEMVAKVQAYTGARGKAGGVLVTKEEDELRQFIKKWLGNEIATEQTGSRKLPVDAILIEHAIPHEDELYVGMVIDRSNHQVQVILSSQGGMSIEQVAEAQPEKISTFPIHLLAGVQGFQVRNALAGLGLSQSLARSLTVFLKKMYTLFLRVDASQIEINPLVIIENDVLCALDAKVILDDNALFLHPELEALRDAKQEDQREHEAYQHGLNYISLDGNIGCMVNGAGLAMATMDLVQLSGGAPANFLDVGGGATPERVAEAFKIILSDNKVKAILINIFGGIVRCDVIAEGIVQAIREVHVSIPVIVRLEGTRSDEGRQVLKESGLSVIPAGDLSSAALAAVKAVA